MERDELERERRFEDKQDYLKGGYKNARLLDVEPWRSPPDLLHMQKAIILKLLMLVSYIQIHLQMKNSIISGE